VSESVQILPLALAMVMGPQIMTSVFLVTSRRPVPNSLTYVGAAALAVAVGTLLAFGISNLLGVAEQQEGGGKDALTYVLVGLLAVLIVYTYVRRHELEPPKWMGELQEADQRLAGKLGLLLIFLMPTDIVIMLGVGDYLVAGGLDWFSALPFIGLTVLLLALPLLAYLLLGEAAARSMPAIRDWMSTYSWLISIIVYAFFIYLFLA
jgi:hypothetical protein